MNALVDVFDGKFETTIFRNIIFSEHLFVVRDNIITLREDIEYWCNEYLPNQWERAIPSNANFFNTEILRLFMGDSANITWYFDKTIIQSIWRAKSTVYLIAKPNKMVPAIQFSDSSALLHFKLRWL